jgi:DNA-binding transcriptional ArsR family regulator
MASTTSDLANPTEDLDRVFQALSDRTRRAILVRLADEPATVTALAEPFAMSLPAVSKHLRVLERARLVSTAVDGRLHFCSLDPAALQVADDWLAPYRTFWSEQFVALDRHLRRGRIPARRGGRRSRRGPSRPATRDPARTRRRTR